MAKRIYTRTATKKPARDRMKEEILKALTEIDLREKQEKSKFGKIPDTHSAEYDYVQQKLFELEGEHLGITVLAHRLGYKVSYKDNTVSVRKYKSAAERDMFGDGMWL